MLYAQSLPATVHVTWTPSVADSNNGPASQYSVVTDDGTPVVVQSSTCTSTLCTATISINSYGQHSTLVTAQNFKIDSDPTTLQGTSAPAKVWVLNQGPASPSNVAIKN